MSRDIIETQNLHTIRSSELSNKMRKIYCVDMKFVSATMGVAFMHLCHHVAGNTHCVAVNHSGAKTVNFCCYSWFRTVIYMCHLSYHLSNIHKRQAER